MRSSKKCMKTMPGKLLTNYRLLMLPFIRGKVLFNSNTDRMKKLELASTFYKAYFDLCDHYGVLPIQLGTVMEQIKKGQYKADREVKIKMYKAQKVAEDEASSLEAKYLQGSANKRDYLRSLLMLKCFQALSDIEIIPQELEMLKFRQKLDTDDAFKHQYQAEMNKQRPKPYFYKLDDGSEGGNKAMQINSADVKRVGGTPATLGQYETKLDIKDKLWQPDFAQPKMTMDEHGELESRLMIEKAERDKENSRLEKEKMDLLNEEEQHELENLKSRAWDDWKDLNEKGAGNKQR